MRDEYLPDEPVANKRPMAKPNKKDHEALKSFVGSLRETAEKRVKERQPVEERWLEDLRQYHGIYDETILKALKERKRSEVYLNLTRPKVNGVIARLSELLFPTDEENWTIEPTPVPEIDRTEEETSEIAAFAEENLAAAQGAMDRANEAQNPQGIEQARQDMNEAERIMQEASDAATRLREDRRIANAQSRLMSDEIADQLDANDYPGQCRKVIDHGVKLGTGVLKGPVVQGKTRRRFAQTETGFQLVEQDEAYPSAEWVDVWSFFPDNDVEDPADGDGVFQRHLLNHKQMRDLQKRSDIDVDALRRVFKEGPKADNNPWYLTALVNLTGDKSTVIQDNFTVWEYTGEITGEQLEMLSKFFEDANDEMGDREEEQEIDPLFRMQARIWFSGDEILSFAVHPLDSEECMYSIWNYERAEHGPWGYGVPAVIRHPQKVAASAQRMIVDAGGLSAVPQLLIDKSQVTPENGEWIIEPGKAWTWLSPEEGSSGRPPMQVLPITANLGDLNGIIDLARRSIDELTVPTFANGDSHMGDHGTFRGLAIKYNNALSAMRRLVRDFDDRVTKPMIRRFYHWNMQHSPKEEIKGDYMVTAKGLGALQREMQVEMLTNIAQQFGEHPIWGQQIHGNKLMELIFRSITISTADLLKTDRELKAEMEQQQEASPEAQAMQKEASLKEKDLEVRMAEIEARVEIANMESDTKRYVADRDYDAVLNRLEVQFNIKSEELESADRRNLRETDARERGLATEVAMARETGQSAGGAV